MSIQEHSTTKKIYSHYFEQFSPPNSKGKNDGWHHWETSSPGDNDYERMTCSLRSAIARDIIEHRRCLDDSLHWFILKELRHHQEHRLEDLKCLLNRNKTILKYVNDKKIHAQNEILEQLIKDHTEPVQNFEDIRSSDIRFWESGSFPVLYVNDPNVTFTVPYEEYRRPNN